MKKIAAAAVVVGDVVMAPYGDKFIEIVVSDIANATPVAGQITWWDETSHEYVVPAAKKIEIKQMEK